MFRNWAMIGAATLVLGVVGCGGDSGDGDGGGGGAGGSGGTLSNFVEPDLPCEAPAFDPREHTKAGYLVMQFPPEASCGRWQQTYWASPGEPVVFDAIVGLGPNFPGSRCTIEARMLIDGEIVPIVWDDATSAQKFAFDLDPMTYRRFSADLSKLDLAAGGHSATLHVTYDSAEMRTYLSHDFVIMARATEFASPEPAAVALEPSADLITVLFQDAEAATDLPWHIPYPDAGMRRVALEFAPLPKSSTIDGTNVVLLALLDGEQVPLGVLGMAPSFYAPSGHRARIEWDLAFPAAAGSHLLELFWRTGFQEPAEDEEGNPLPYVHDTRRAVYYWLEGAAAGAPAAN